MIYLLPYAVSLLAVIAIITAFTYVLSEITKEVRSPQIHFRHVDGKRHGIDAIEN
jgi:hypothetical protein